MYRLRSLTGMLGLYFRVCLSQSSHVAPDAHRLRVPGSRPAVNPGHLSFVWIYQEKSLPEAAGKWLQQCRTEEDSRKVILTEFGSQVREPVECMRAYLDFWHHYRRDSGDAPDLWAFQPLLFCCEQQAFRTLELYECLQDHLLDRKSFLHLKCKASFPFTVGISHFLSCGSLDWDLMWLAVTVHDLFCWDCAFLAL